jgi:enoyl-CoA hydratase/carnithine racemase
MNTDNRGVGVEVEVAYSDSVVWLTMNRGAGNLLTPPMMRSLRSLLTTADEDEDVGAIVLTGAGADFCAGLDTGELRGGGDPIEFATELVSLLKLFPRLGKPLLTAVNGDALASGFSLVVASDWAIAVESSKLGTYESSVGVWPMIAQVPLLQRLLPRHALSNIITGIPFTAQHALEIGAVNATVPANRLREAVEEQLPLLVRSGAHLAGGRRFFYRALDLSYEQALDESLDEFVAMVR